MEVYETTILRPLHKLIKVFASCFVRSALGRRRLPSFFPASGFWTVQDGQAAISRCWLLRAMQQRLRMPTRTRCAGRAACGSDSAFQSATESRCFWWLRRRMKFPRPQMARSASAYWLAIRERRFSTKSRSMWKILARWNIRHHWVQSVPISCSLARNVPLQSFVGPLRYCRSSVVLCNAPLWSFAVFSHTVSYRIESFLSLVIIRHYWTKAHVNNDDFLMRMLYKDPY